MLPLLSEPWDPWASAVPACGLASVGWNGFLNQHSKLCLFWKGDRFGRKHAFFTQVIVSYLWIMKETTVYPQVWDMVKVHMKSYDRFSSEWYFPVTGPFRWTTSQVQQKDNKVKALTYDFSDLVHLPLLSRCPPIPCACVASCSDTRWTSTLKVVLNAFITGRENWLSWSLCLLFYGLS